MGPVDLVKTRIINKCFYVIIKSDSAALVKQLLSSVFPSLSQESIKVEINLK